MPLIPAFRDYLPEALQSRWILKKLTVLSIREKLDAWVLTCQKDDVNIVAVVEYLTVTDKDGKFRVAVCEYMGIEMIALTLVGLKFAVIDLKKSARVRWAICYL